MYFSLDLGGTNLRISWLDSLQNINIANLHIFPNRNNYIADSNLIIDLIKKTSPETTAVAIGIAGSMNSDNQSIIHSNNLIDYIDKPIVSDFSNLLHSPVYLRNDASLASLGEVFFGDVPREEFIYITWGTGVGGSKVTFENNLPLVTDLSWSKYFKEIDYKCSGGHSIDNFGCELKLINDDEWKILTEIFVSEIIKITDLLGIKRVVLGGGITSKEPKRVIIFRELLSEKGIVLHPSKLNNNSGIYGGYSLLRQIFN